jgi:hypothetical protein
MFQSQLRLTFFLQKIQNQEMVPVRKEKGHLPAA